MSMLWVGRALAPDEVTALRQDPDRVWDLVDVPAEPGKVIHLDKAWHGLHWVLTGSAWDADGALGKVILGGEEFGEDGGYGPARLLAPAEVGEVAVALEQVSADELRARFDPVAMSAAGIYPDVWADEPQILEARLLPGVEDLRAFYTAAAAGGAWVLHALG